MRTHGRRKTLTDIRFNLATLPGTFTAFIVAAQAFTINRYGAGSGLPSPVPYRTLAPIISAKDKIGYEENRIDPFAHTTVVSTCDGQSTG
jgi:hypothetical protein